MIGKCVFARVPFEDLVMLNCNKAHLMFSLVVAALTISSARQIHRSTDAERRWKPLERSRKDEASGSPLLAFFLSQATVEFLKAKMKPLSVDALRIQKLLIDLDSKKE